MSTYRSLLLLLACALVTGVAACGGNGGSGGGGTSAPATSAAPPSASATAGSGSADSKQVAANWTAFFDAKTPVAKRVSLLEDGQQFASVIKSQAGGGLAASASAKVKKVDITSATQATVTYDILVGGQTALANRTGTAVKQDGTWKVGVDSFCGLLILENGGKTAGLPSACKSAAG